MRNFYISSGVYPQELDLTNRAAPNSTTIAGVAFPSRQGYTEPYFCTDLVDFENIYGPTDYAWSFAHGCIKAFLKKGRGIWLKRVVKEALYAGLTVANDLSGVRATKSTVQPFAVGRKSDYTLSGQEYQSLYITAPLVTGNTISVTIVKDGEEETITATFDTNSDNTLQKFVDKLNAYLSSEDVVIEGSTRGYASVEKVPVATDNDRLVRIVSPEGIDLDFYDAKVTGGASQAAVVVDPNPWLMEIYSIGPGGRYNDYGVQFVNVDNGVNQRLSFSFSSAMGAASRFQADATVSNGKAIKIGPVAYDTTQLKTAQKIVDEFKKKLGSTSDGWVNDGANGLTITIVSPVDGPNTLKINNAIVTDMTNAPSISVSQVLGGIDRDQTFELWVYDRQISSIRPQEKHLVSFINQIDGYGRQLFIEDAINTSGDRSNLIRIRFNHLNGAGNLTDIPPQGSPIYWLSGGEDGLLPSSSDIAGGYQEAFKSRRKRPLRLLFSAGQSSTVVGQKIDILCQSRRDCFGILDIPSQVQVATDAVSHRQLSLGINSSYTGAYLPDVRVIDEKTNTPFFLPPSGHVAAQFAYNDQVAAEWLSPAGLTRGLVTEIDGLRYEYDEAELDLLAAAQLNSIVKVDGGGYQIKEALTLQTKASALSNIPVRRLLITIEVTLVEALDYTIHEPNTDFTGFLIVQICTNFLQPIKDAQGLYDFAVVSDSRNTKSYNIDGGQRNVDVYLKPVLPIRYLQLTSIITKTGAFFQEIIAALNGGTISAN